LYNINKDLQLHKRSRSAVMEEAITERLNTSLQSYSYDLNSSFSYLTNRSSTRLFGRMSRRKIDDKPDK
jgi:hypothetical protein